jgi:hypothetical protein
LETVPALLSARIETVKQPLNSLLKVENKSCRTHCSACFENRNAEAEANNGRICDFKKSQKYIQYNGNVLDSSLTIRI